MKTANHTSNKAFTLIEMMLAILLSTIVVGMLLKSFIDTKAMYRTQKGMSQMQDTARIARHFLQKTIRMGGYQGCANISALTANVVVKNPTAEMLLSNMTAVNGYDGITATTWSPTLLTVITAKPFSDVINVRLADNLGIEIKQPMVQGNNPVLVNDRKTIAADDIVMITDCLSADIFQAEANPNATAIPHTMANNTTNDLSKAYGMDAQIMLFRSYSFYIKDSGRTNLTGLPIYSLYRKDLSNNELELAQGVEDMQIEYAVDTNGDKAVDTYMTAQAVQAGGYWPSVYGVKISLLVDSVEEYSPAAQAYRYRGTVVTPTDRKMRKEYVIFVALRNKGVSI